jgi:hypothetical protein
MEGITILTFSNSELVPLSNSQFDNLVSDLCNDDSDFDDILKTFDTRNIRALIKNWHWQITRSSTGSRKIWQLSGS